MVHLSTGALERALDEWELWSSLTGKEIWLLYHNFWTFLWSFPSHDSKGKMLESADQFLICTGLKALDILTDRHSQGKHGIALEGNKPAVHWVFPLQHTVTLVDKGRETISLCKQSYPYLEGCHRLPPDIPHFRSSQHWISGMILHQIQM